MGRGRGEGRVWVGGGGDVLDFFLLPRLFFFYFFFVALACAPVSIPFTLEPTLYSSLYPSALSLSS